MKKIFTLFACATLLTQHINAQTFGGPDAYGYMWRTNADPQGQPYSWIDITTLPGVVDISSQLSDDNVAGPFSLQIPFHYYWYDPSNFYIGANGYIAFSASSAALAAPFAPMQTAANPNNLIAAMGCDLLFNVNGLPVGGAWCKYWIAPTNDTLIVTWNAPFWDPTGFVGINTFQAILSTVDSSITVQYFDQQGVYTNPASFLTAGIENVSGAIGLQYIYDFYPTPNTSVKYYYPPVVTMQINDASTAFVNNTNTQGLFLAKNGAAYTSMAEVKNTGNQPLASFNVYSRVINSSNGIQVRDTVPSNALVPGQSQQITFPDTWVPSAQGVYRHIVVTQLTGDATPTNNLKELELQVVDTALADVVLKFNNGISSSGGVSWNGGGAGIGIHFVPPFYPCYLNKVGALCTADAAGSGFYFQIFADDGPNGSPLTMLDSFPVPSGTFTPGVYYETPLATSIPITSGGFYVAWMMWPATGPVLGEDTISPHSNQSYEILGPAGIPASWSGYRNGEIYDPIINAVVSQNPLSLKDVSENNGTFGDFYPNPANLKSKISFSLRSNETITLKLISVEGKTVAAKTVKDLHGAGSLEIDVSKLDAGIYMCLIDNGSRVVTRKVSVAR